MMSCLTALMACGPEMTGDEEALLEPEEPGQELQTSLKSLKEIELTEVGCTSVYTLSNGVAKTGLNAPDKTWSCIYTITPPAGSTNLKFETSEGTGDADLYVKFGSAPTDGVYDLSSAYSSGNTESINVATPQSGTYYVRFFGYSAVSGVSLKASYTTGTSPPTSCSTTYTLSNGSSRTGLTAGEKVWSCTYALAVPSGATDLRFTTSGGTGDADLYVKFGSIPTDGSSDFSSAGGGNSENVTVPTPQAGTYYVRLFGYSAASGITLTGSYTPGTPPPTSCSTTYTLSNGSPRTGVAAGEKIWSCIYALSVPAGATDLKFTTSGGTGDADLYVKFASTPTESSYDFSSAAGGNSESITIPTAQGGTYYVRLFGYHSATGITLTGSYTPGTPPPTSCSTTYTLSNGSPRTGISAATGLWSCIYTLYVPAGKTSVTFQTSGGTGDAELYVQLGSTPTSTSYACFSAAGGNTESCTISSPQGGTYYVRLYGYSTASGITLTGQY